MKSIILFLTVVLLSTTCLRAQDPHFTQFNMQPLLLNPALT